jgi:uncharacterized membrane protein (UPF0127 family)
MLLERKMTRTLSIAIFVSAALLGSASCRAPAETTEGNVPSLQSNFERDTLIIESDDGLQHEFDVYLATSFEQQRRGLMFVRKMPDTTGMLFIYEDTDYHSMWMKNTYISLDLVFARKDGTVSSVIHAAQPLSLTSQASIEPVNFVLELNAGTARRLHIGNKSRIVRHSAAIEAAR